MQPKTTRLFRDDVLDANELRVDFVRIVNNALMEVRCQVIAKMVGFDMTRAVVTMSALCQDDWVPIRRNCVLTHKRGKHKGADGCD